MKIQWEDYNPFGLTLSVPQIWSSVNAIAETGYHSCLAGLRITKQFGVFVHDLILVTVKMREANNDNIKILGASVLRLSGKNKKGEEW